MRDDELGEPRPNVREELHRLLDGQVREVAENEMPFYVIAYYLHLRPEDGAPPAYAQTPFFVAHPAHLPVPDGAAVVGSGRWNDSEYLQHGDHLIPLVGLREVRPVMALLIEAYEWDDNEITWKEETTG